MKAHQRLYNLQRSLPTLRLSALGLTGSLVFLVALVLYLQTLTSAHTYDALSYALSVDTRSWREVFHPHHLAYGPLGVLVREFAGLFGWNGSVVLPLQVTNAVAGALGVALLFGLVRSLTRRLDLALCAAVLLGGSYAYWYYAVEVEVYTIAAVFLVICLGLLVRLLRAPTPRICMALGVAQGLAVLFHQTNALLTLPVGLALLLAGGKSEEPRWRLALAYALPLALVAGLPYLLVGFGVHRFASVGKLSEWLLTYASTGLWGGPVTGDTWQRLGTGLSSALAHPAGALLGWLLVGLLVLYLRHLWQRYPALVACLGCWLLVYGLFFAWWEPDNAEFWIASLPPAVLLLVLALGAAGPRWHAGVWVVLAIGAATAAGNYNAIMLRGSGAYAPQLAVARELAQVSQPDDFVLVPDGLQELYLHYYQDHTNTLPLSFVLQETGGDWQATCERLQRRIEHELSRGVAVYIGEGVLQPALIDDPLLERIRPPQPAVDACFAPYRPALESLHLAPYLPAYHRLPPAHERLAGNGWHFDGTRWGWRAGNALDETYIFYDTDEVWSFVPRNDPYIKSPHMEIDTDTYWAVQVRLAKGVSNREAQLFFVDDHGWIEEARSLRWELANHADLKTYHLDLRDHPAWNGTVWGLRIDPSTGPDDDEGERIAVAWVRLLSYADDPPDPDE